MRNKNAGREEYDYDLNIFIPEEIDRNGESFWDPTQWHIHVYAYKDGGHSEVADARKLTADEIYTLGLNRDPYFEDVDSWYGYKGFMFDYWDKMTDSLKQYLESFPKYVTN